MPGQQLRLCHGLEVHPDQVGPKQRNVPGVHLDSNPFKARESNALADGGRFAAKAGQQDRQSALPLGVPLPQVPQNLLLQGVPPGPSDLRVRQRAPVQVTTPNGSNQL